MTKCFPRLVFSQHTWIMALTTVPWCQWTKRSSNPFTTLQFFAGGCWEDSYPALKRSCIQDLAWMPRALLLYTSKFYDFLTVIPVWATVIITGFYCFFFITVLLCIFIVYSFLKQYWVRIYWNCTTYGHLGVGVRLTTILLGATSSLSTYFFFFFLIKQESSSCA